MDPRILLFGVLCLFVGGNLVVRVIKARRELRVLRDTPTSPVGALVEGTVEVVGRADTLSGHSVSAAAWSGKDIVFVRYQIEEKRSSGKHSTWVTVKEWRDPDRFVVDDGSGRALVIASDCDVDIAPTFRGASSLGHDPPACVMDTICSKQVDFEGIFGLNKSMRFNEFAIERGATVLVSGMAIEAPEAKAAKGARFAIADGPAAPLLVTTKSEAETTRALRRTVIGSSIGAFVALLLGAGLLAAQLLKG